MIGKHRGIVIVPISELDIFKCNLPIDTKVVAESLNESLDGNSVYIKIDHDSIPSVEAGAQYPFVKLEDGKWVVV